ncbi:MAG: UDP-glucose 4-epimerase [Flavobacterium sp.]|nr:UDP-glucose 4-epimerase [Flavobacterium sp.]
MKKTILVTGGAGFIGSHLVDHLIKEGCKVIVIDNLSTGKKENLNQKAKFYKIDIRDKKNSQIFEKEKPKIVFHLAAQIDLRKSVEDPVGNASINILGTLNLLENCKRFKIKKFIFTSTGGAMYGEANIIPTPENYPEQPLSPYGVEKLTIEKYLNYYYKVFGLPFVSLRLANVYGPRQDSRGEAGVVAIFIDKLLNNEVPTINGDGEQTRDFLCVDDAVEVAMLTLRNPVAENPIYNVGTAIETSVNNLYKLLIKKFQKNIQPKYAPAKTGEQRRSCLDYSKIKKDFGWQPKYNLEEGLEKTIQWFKIKNNY